MLFLKKKDSTSLDIKELSDRLNDSEEKGRFFLHAVRALLVFVKDFSLDLKEIDAVGFKKGIDDLSEVFVSETKTRKIESFFEKHKKTIGSYIKQQEEYLHERENELKGIIDLLSKAMATIDAENENYNQKIHEQTDKIEKITLLDDIKKIKKALSYEINQMRKTVREKQKRDNDQIETLSKQVSSLNLELKKAKEESSRDGLTNVYNRKAFDRHIKNFVERITVTHLTFSMLILDVDDFKKINDTYGHQIGDRVLLAIVNKCREFTRNEDFIARYGGDEFVIVLLGVSLRNAVKRARHLSKVIASTRYLLSDVKEGLSLSFSVSIGAATHRKGDTADTVIERADKALYTAKHSGKNQVASEKDLKQ